MHPSCKNDIAVHMSWPLGVKETLYKLTYQQSEIVHIYKLQRFQVITYHVECLKRVKSIYF